MLIRIDADRRKVRNWQRFTLTGQTFPALAHRWLQVRADPRLYGRTEKPPRAHVILTVRTDKDGRFTSRPVYLKRAAAWVLTSKLLRPGQDDPAASCNGTIETREGWYRPRWVDLKGFTFVSTKVKGHDLGVRKVYRRNGSVRRARKNRVSLSFSLSPRWSPNIPDMQDWPLVPSVSPDTGCNSMGGEVSVKNGVIKADGSFFSTAMLCMPDNDSWIMGLLGKGLKGTMKDRRLILKRGKTVITLKRTWFASD
jgi:hypothetical protein